MHWLVLLRTGLRPRLKPFVTVMVRRITKNKNGYPFNQLQILENLHAAFADSIIRRCSFYVFALTPCLAACLAFTTTLAILYRLPPFLLSHNGMIQVCRRI